MTTGRAGANSPGIPRTPNRVLRGIRERERHETREQFAEAMARLARDMGETAYPDAKYVAKLETGGIGYPRPLYRHILSELCGRPFAELGFASPSRSTIPLSDGSSGLGSGKTFSATRVGQDNIALRNAIMASSMELPQFARKVGVDPKTVQRWITKSRTPHPRHRWEACRILGRDESELWPGHAGPYSHGRNAGDKNSGPDESPGISELCAVLTDYGSGVSQLYSSTRDTVPPLCDIERELETVFVAYQQSRFTAAASRISTLLADAQIAAREYKGAEQARAQGILAMSHQAAASVLTKAGQSDIAWIAAERGLSAAERSGISSVRLSLVRSVAFALLSAGRLESAIKLVESAAENLADKTAGRDDTGLSVYGTLFLAGSMAAARFGDGAKTAEYLQEADRAASRLGRDANYLWTAFGPTNVAIHRVNTAIELGDIQAVLSHGLSLNTDAVPTERRVRYLLDVARTYSLTKNREDALVALLAAERLAPEQTRRHYLTGKVIATLMKDAIGKPSIELAKLAGRANYRELA